MMQLLNVGLVEAVDEQVTETKVEKVAEVKGDNSTEPTRNKRKPKTVSK